MLVCTRGVSPQTPRVQESSYRNACGGAETHLRRRQLEEFFGYEFLGFFVIHDLVLYCHLEGIEDPIKVPSTRQGHAKIMSNPYNKRIENK